MKQKINLRLITISVLVVLITVISITLFYYELFQEQVKRGLRTEAKILSAAGLSGITENDEKMSVGDVNIQFDKSTGKLAGTIVVNFYAMLGNGVAYKEPDTTGFTYGVNNVFGATK